MEQFDLIRRWLTWIQLIYSAGRCNSISLFDWIGRCDWISSISEFNQTLIDCCQFVFWIWHGGSPFQFNRSNIISFDCIKLIEFQRSQIYWFDLIRRCIWLLSFDWCDSSSHSIPHVGHSLPSHVCRHFFYIHSIDGDAMKLEMSQSLRIYPGEIQICPRIYQQSQRIFSKTTENPQNLKEFP